MENRPVDPGSIQGSHRSISFMIKHRTRADDILCKTENNHIVCSVHQNHIIRTCLMYHAACKIEFQPFKQVVLRPMTMETRCSQTDDNGNAMFQSYLSKIFKKKKPAEDTLVPPLWGTRGKKKMFVLLGLFFHAAVLVRGGTCAFTLKIVNTLIKNSSRDD